ncbi:hypothetical protein ACKZDW_24150 [Ralstonia syzygii subsp. celebesensis]
MVPALYLDRDRDQSGVRHPGVILARFSQYQLRAPTQATYPWLQNAGMLLVGISLFYAPAGIHALKYPVYAWLCVLSRLIAVVFWIDLINTSGYPDAFRP